VLERLLGNAEPDLASLCLKAAQQAGASARADEACNLLAPFVQSKLFSVLRACRVLACEMPFSVLAQDGSLETGVMDAVLEKPDGSVWIIDYKTDRLRAGQEQHILQEKYAHQLGIYKQVAQQIFSGKTVYASVIFVRTATAADL
jgi:ATP-dependent helicase/nuclease subunit A